MRILILTTGVGGHGGVQYAGNLMLRALCDCISDESQLSLVTLTDDRADVACLPAQCSAFPGRGSRLRTGVRAVRLLRQARWDLVFVGHLNLAPLILVGDPLRKLPMVVFIHSVEAWKPLKGFRRRALMRADKVLFNSRHTMGRVRAANPWVESMNQVVCHLGLLPESSGKKACTHSGVLDSKVISEPFALSVGRMASVERHKGHEELIRLWPKVAQLRAGLKLVIIGDGDDRSRLQELAHRSGANVQFLGSVNDAVRDVYLRQCKCFCLPARGEGFGLVYLEAMQCSKPVVAGCGDAGAEIVLDGVTGRTVDPADAESLLGGILDVTGDQGEEMGCAGYRRFLEHFAYDKFRDRFSRHVLDILEEDSL
jgi:phosphatidyl-myo-inositol dimannoside synthase